VPKDCQVSLWGQDRSRDRQVLHALYNLLPNRLPADNNKTPSGYTYLLQLVAHDLVATTVPFWSAAETATESRNVRGTGLRLDTLYGGGPTTCPIAFKPAGGQPDFRTELRLGKVAGTDLSGPATATWPLRDLPRVELNAAAQPSSNFANWLSPSNLGTSDDASEVYIADIRNDDNIILAQLVVLFAIMHNAIARKLSAAGAGAPFAIARIFMLKMYYAIIRHDLLSLLLCPEVYGILSKRSAASDQWLWKSEKIPLEFTHGVFRVGHAMVRPSYQFNAGNRFTIYDVVGGPNFGASTRQPLPPEWILEWCRFFELGPTAPNYSLKLGARHQSSLDFGHVLPPVAGDTPGTLSERDWLSAAAAQTWRLEALLHEVHTKYDTLPFLGADDIQTWLTELLAAAPGMQQDKLLIQSDIARLTSDLPLPLFVLLEAEKQSAGSHLGTLGSIIVGEVLFRRLAEEEQRLDALFKIASEHADSGPAEPVARTLEEIQRRIADVRFMPALVELAEEWGGLAGCQTIPFVAPGRGNH
jgi:hypothetical protein